MFSSRAGFNGNDENSAVFTKDSFISTRMTANCRHSIAYYNRYGYFKTDKVDCPVMLWWRCAQSLRSSFKSTMIMNTTSPRIFPCGLVNVHFMKTRMKLAMPNPIWRNSNLYKIRLVVKIPLAARQMRREQALPKPRFLNSHRLTVDSIQAQNSTEMVN